MVLDADHGVVLGGRAGYLSHYCMSDCTRMLDGTSWGHITYHSVGAWVGLFHAFSFVGYVLADYFYPVAVWRVLI